MRASFKDDPSIPEDIKRRVAQYEAGQNLQYLKELPGYTDILNILREDIVAAENKLRRYRDSDSEEVLRLLAELQGKEKALVNLESKVASLTALATDPPEEIQKFIHF